ncbi:MAG: ABC transporter ATP-binding protein [Candidatus Spyradocola sp.]|nr:ABC transporter ATP-binding protein [Candidatus Spyradocola sp.]
MKKIVKYINGSWPLVFLAPLLMVLEVMCDLMQPTLMSEIVDVGIASGEISMVWSTGIKMLGVALLGIVGGAGCTILSSKASFDAAARLRQGMFDKIQTFSFKEIDKLQTSSLITRLTNDVTIMQQTLRAVLCMMVRAPLTCVGGLVMAIAISRQLSMIFVVAIPVLAIAVTIVALHTFPMFAKMQQKIDRVNTVMRENLLGVRVVKAFVGQEKEKERFQGANEDLMNWSLQAMNRMIVLMPIVTAVMNFSVVALLWFGGNLVNIGHLEVGKIMAFMTYLMQVLGSLMMAVMMMMQFSRAKVAADRCAEVLTTESSIVDPAKPKEVTDFTVRFDHVNFSYNDTDPEPVLKDITFTAKPGQRVGIIGNTGSGKSTLVSLIPRLYDVTDGSVSIGGVDVRDLDMDALRRHIGVVLQESTLFSGNIESNLRWGGGDCQEDRLRHALDDAQATEFVSKLPDGIGSIVEQRGKNFSGGQKQRLSIARTFAKEPDILILDDSTSAVDTETEAKLQQALRRRVGRGVTFVIAQRVSAIADSDLILVMEDGAIVGQGTHQELIRNNEVYRGIVASQWGEEAIA